MRKKISVFSNLKSLFLYAISTKTHGMVVFMDFCVYNATKKNYALKIYLKK